MKHPIYFGNENNYLRMSSTVGNKINYTVPDGSFLYIWVPNGQDKQFLIGGLIGGFSFIETRRLFNVDYYIYKTVNRSLGKLIITIL